MSGSFDHSSFIRDVDAMFVRVEAQIDQIVEVWKAKVAEYLVITTPGPGNQYYTTEYIATGRLRAGYSYSLDAPSGVTLMGISGREDGDDRASATIARLKGEIQVEGLVAISYLWNDVGYGVYVHEGIGNHVHIGPRPFVQETALIADELYEEARAEVMSGHAA